MVGRQTNIASFPPSLKQYNAGESHPKRIRSVEGQVGSTRVGSSRSGHIRSNKRTRLTGIQRAGARRDAELASVEAILLGYACFHAWMMRSRRYCWSMSFIDLEVRGWMDFKAGKRSTVSSRFQSLRNLMYCSFIFVFVLLFSKTLEEVNDHWYFKLKIILPLHMLFTTININNHYV